MKAPKHTDEAERLAALGSFEILDTDTEEPFDDVVKLASAICGMPVSLISLVDADRQWFKARSGLDATETTLEESICAHALLEEDGFLEIQDATKDPRTADNPLVTGEMGLRYYAGAVLTSTEGQPIGSLCVLDTQPNKLTALQRDTLRVLARQVIAQMELKRSLQQAELMRREVDHRVKNSLQSVSALTRMQARDVHSDETRAALEHVRRRIETVASLHEQLYRAENSETINLNAFGTSVCRLVGGSAPPNVRIASSWPTVDVDASVAAALGVILNEFAANTFKHAFPDGRDGVIRCHAEVREDSRCDLVLSDDGVGLPGGVTMSHGLGMQVIEASARQLGGAFALESGPQGTKITLDFPLQDEENLGPDANGALARA
ncbi:histidine kinase dimerization/phosphoacceptor domain -containing protein [Pseudooceanicola sp. HF7]|uniref:histidine kinase dimerization/phosphoacceptor domain -containing protein n=1 Tax=Pseudooceanicola sp. HF7 TaxID=2721560 RepID=UPI0014311112|nr:histidine kinase dimerization/phosphoacceptor domain -containing protein [Pseudooceanicola sp. HF7]NIZ11462.1 GAF domain-containing protein [Pseudooceanicola sp. HF7]